MQTLAGILTILALIVLAGGHWLAAVLIGSAAIVALLVGEPVKVEDDGPWY